MRARRSDVGSSQIVTWVDRRQRGNKSRRADRSVRRRKYTRTRTPRYTGLHTFSEAGLRDAKRGNCTHKRGPAAALEGENAAADATGGGEGQFRVGGLAEIVAAWRFRCWKPARLIRRITKRVNDRSDACNDSTHTRRYRYLDARISRNNERFLRTVFTICANLWRVFAVELFAWSFILPLASAYGEVI